VFAISDRNKPQTQIPKIIPDIKTPLIYIPRKNEADSLNNHLKGPNTIMSINPENLRKDANDYMLLRNEFYQKAGSFYFILVDSFKRGQSTGKGAASYYADEGLAKPNPKDVNWI
jgi:hypothetical protein